MQDKYSTRQIIIHWLTLFLVIAAVYLGHELDETDRIAQAAEKLELYPLHFLAGLSILALTLVRIFFLLKDGKPAPLPGSNEKDNKKAAAVQGVLYLLLLAVPVSGVVMNITSGLADAVSAKDAAKLPDLEPLLIHEIHFALVAALLAFAALHAVSALVHQFVLKDGIMDRMSLRCRSGNCKKD